MKEVSTNNIEKQRQKFLKLFYSILDEPENSSIISWHGNGFVILDVEQFKNTLLPKHFRHNNYQSLMRQLNKYGFKIKAKENEKAYFTHPTINSDNRETKRVLTITKNITKLDYKKELEQMKSQLDNLKKGQRILKQQLAISIKIMIILQKQYSKLTMMTLHAVGFANCFGNLMYENHKKVWGNIGGDFYKLQLKCFADAFPEILEANVPTPQTSNFGTPLPFYSMLSNIKQYSNIIQN